MNCSINEPVLLQDGLRNHLAERDQETLLAIQRGLEHDLQAQVQRWLRIGFLSDCATRLDTSQPRSIAFLKEELGKVLPQARFEPAPAAQHDPAAPAAGEAPAPAPRIGGTSC